MPAEIDHPVFEAPSDPNIKIWRYMNFAKFVSLLDSSSLFFSRADMLGDPYEGAMSHFNKAIWPKVYSEPISKALMTITPHNTWMRQWTYINCWHMNETESAAMWHLYLKSNEAVAIQSTYEDLHRLMPKDTFIGVVKYIDYRTEWMPEGNALYPYIHKRRSFEHERELRAVRIEYHIVKEGNKSSFDHAKTNSESGKYIPVNLESLVKNVYIAPTAPAWFHSLVESTVRKYGLAIPVTHSIIDEPPTF